jgi:hypothetical protein
MLEAIFGGCLPHCGGCCFSLTLILIVCCVVVGGTAYYVSTQGPQPPLSDNFKPSYADAQAFQSAMDNATAMASNRSNGGWFYLTFTERQMASWMALNGEDFAAQHGHDFPFKNVQVKLDNGVMTFYGELGRSLLTIPLKATVRPQIDNTAKLTLDITEVNVGGLRVPDAILSSISSQFEDVLLQPFSDLPGTPFFYQGSLSISGGLFSVQGGITY